MKNFVIALILLILIIAFTIVNSVIITNIADKLIQMVNGDINQLADYWQEKYYYISISTHSAVLEEADIAISDMRAYLETESYEDYNAAKKRFLNAVDEIKTGEMAVLYNIF